MDSLIIIKLSDFYGIVKLYIVIYCLVIQLNIVFIFCVILQVMLYISFTHRFLKNSHNSNSMLNNS